MNEKADGYRGIWYCCNGVEGELRYKYSGGLGTYCAKHIPLAHYAKEVNKTFFCYGGVSGETGELLEMVSCYDHNTGTVPRPTILMNKHTTDAHDNVVIALDEDGFVWAFASAHGTSRPAYIFKSREPHSVEQFDLVVERNFSYPQPWYVDGKGFLFLHTEYEDANDAHGRSLYWMTSRDGVAWSEPQLLSRIVNGHYQISWRCGEKVGTAFNYHQPAGCDWRTNLYYLETRDMGNTWRTAGGYVVEAPLREVANDALVHDYKSESLLVYMKDLNYDQEGRPIIMYLTSRGIIPGPESSPRTWTIAHWTGTQWAIRKVTESDNNYDTGCLHVEPDGTWRIIGPTETGPQPFNPGGEIAVWTSNDEGESWKMVRQVTAGSQYNHTYARRPVNAHPDFYAFWADGHGREPSPSRLYFCDKTGKNVYRLPETMEREREEPEAVG